MLARGKLNPWNCNRNCLQSMKLKLCKSGQDALCKLTEAHQSGFGVRLSLMSRGMRGGCKVLLQLHA